MIWARPSVTHAPASAQKENVLLCRFVSSQGHPKAGWRGEERGSHGRLLPLQVPSAAASQFGKQDLPVAPGCVNTSPFSLSAGLPAACMTHTTIHGSPVSSSTGVPIFRLSFLPEDYCVFSYKREDELFQIDPQSHMGLIKIVSALNQPKRVKRWSMNYNCFLPHLPKDVTLELTAVIPATWPKRGTSRWVGLCRGQSPGLPGCCHLPGAHTLWLPKLSVPPRRTCFSVNQLPHSGWPPSVQSHSRSTKCHLGAREAEAILSEAANGNFCWRG